MTPLVSTGTRLPGKRDLPSRGGRVHLMGIGGAGMRGLAVLLRDAGYQVSGCDRGGAGGLDEIVDIGIPVEDRHHADHSAGADLLIRTSAVPPDADEVQAAAQRGVPVLSRAQALGALLNDRTLVGIAGTHGKTTITGMTGVAAEHSGLDPIVLVGGSVTNWDGFTRVGAGPAVVEADEYDRSFLELDPALAVVSSLEAEHLDTYGDIDGVRAAFREFAARAEPDHGLLFCADDEGASALAADLGSGRGYGFSPASWCRVERLDASICRFRWPDGSAEVRLRVPGRHNQQNAAAAFCSCLLLGGDPDAITKGLESFRGIARRLERLGARGDVLVYDDYAHHPTEVAASIAALRDAYPDAKLSVVFQPHLYTRTRDFAPQFAASLDAADQAWVLPIYAAREEPIDGVTSELIVSAAAGAVSHIERAAVRELADADHKGPHVLAFMGAGDVTAVAREAAERLADDAVRK